MNQVERKKPNNLSPDEVNVWVRVIVAGVLLIVGILITTIPFFERTSLVGVSLLTKILIVLAAALVGFFVIPKAFVQVKYWVESIIATTVSQVVSTFWEQQSHRMQEARRDRQKKKNQSQKNKLKDTLAEGILLDTSVLVDGRILDITKTNFLCNKYILPQFVLDELHLISDNEDQMKRNKGRRGLDILTELKKQPKVKVIIPDGLSVPTKEGVDKALVKTAKKFDLRLMTLDYNLNKVAGVSGVEVLNINELSNALRPVFLPGETFEIKIIQEGKEQGQGVGYLSDGTMIVVEGARELINKKIPVKVNKVIQSPAGKMIFAEVA